MMHIGQLVLSFLSLSIWQRPEVPFRSFISSLQHPIAEDVSPQPTKSIAIVGAGSAGLGALKAILDLPEETRAGWEVILFEQRRDVGGIWLPDPDDFHPSPPEIPGTPLYPMLHTNTPAPTMTYPHFPFPGGTTLFPSWDAVQRYHEDFAAHYNLMPHIKVNHTVVSTEWHGNEVEGDWHVTVHVHPAEGGGVIERRTFDRLVVATGHNRYPYIPQWEGTKDWLAGTPAGKPLREILHSVYYRLPDRYANHTVLIVGSGASAYDIANQVGAVASVVYQSVKGNGTTSPTAVLKVPISHFTRDTIVFEDGTTLTDVDAIILGTGYELRVPFMSRPYASELNCDPTTPANSTTAQTLTSNLEYMFPLYRHIFNLAPNTPPTALAFVGLPLLVANAPSDYAQGIFISHAIANASILPSREEMLQELVAREESLRERGYDPYRDGHKLLDGQDETEEYQDDLIAYLKNHGALPDDGKPYVEEWRKFTRERAVYMYRGWRRVQALGDEARWVDGLSSEEDWVDMLDRLVGWEREWEKEHGSGASVDDVYVQLL